MFSAAGVAKYADDYNLRNELTKLKRKPPLCVLGLVGEFWKNKWSPFGVARKSGRGFVNLLMNRYVSRRLPKLSKNVQ